MVEAQREREAAMMQDWLAGEGPHPHGKAGESVLLPAMLTSNTWDTKPTAWRFSEWANLAGMVDE